MTAVRFRLLSNHSLIELRGDSTNYQARQQHTYHAYEKLVQWCPSVHKLVGPAAEANTAGLDITLACTELQKGADGAWGDDSTMLKTTCGRGFNHDVTGKLLCPMDYNWADTEYMILCDLGSYADVVDADSWPPFLYADGKYDLKNPARGLFKGKYLVMTFQCIFTSPSSAQHKLSSGDMAQTSQQSRTPQWFHHHVARLLKMNTIQPQAIAYTATQLCFALSSCSSWMNVDEDFKP
ncbi:hypothetical protein EDD17DRAFT_1762583 [Pisolithus thermaeus]|nr:hypothetical protein EDD17DRAFT_1762583 [Pisolithus thermaeus]